ncbi:MAG: penicillin acylase family protein [Sneathiella sp.]|nr:penicillin acylase family protein [Sneathiella sp.]
MRWIGRVFFGILILAIVIAGGGYIYLRTSLPTLDGAVQVTGLKREVVIIRDEHAIPHIEAKDLNDASFALGYVHAQDRLWQMEMNRRIGAGRLSEILGKAALSKDVFLRTLGVYKAAERTYEQLDEDSKSLLQAYADGVNAFLEGRAGALPPEFLILGVEPEPWTVTDSIVWTKMMAWDLGKNWGIELERLRLLQKLTPEQLAEIMPAYPGETEIPLPEFDGIYKQTMKAADRLFAMAPEPLPEGAGSNNWVVSGDLTNTGKPLLANDPHLGLAAPALWYFAHIKTPEISSIGATLPGVPAVILGRNEHIAWGFTNTGPDTQDLYIEKINPDDPAQYQTPDGWQTFETREEVIPIKGEEAHTITVRSTRHGPILSDALEGSETYLNDGYALAFAWTTLQDGDLTVSAIESMMSAKNWDEFKGAIRDFTSPQQNMVYADVDGNIGYYAPGRVPIRSPENTALGRIPVPGWDAKYDWQGFVPFEELPQYFNPIKGFHYTANEKIVPDDYPHMITRDWSLPYRAKRISDRLEQEETHSVQTFIDLQSDVQSLMAVEFLEILLTTKPANDRDRQALTLLSIWDGSMTKDGPTPLIFNGWMRELYKSIYADELGDLFNSYWRPRPDFAARVLRGEDQMQKWCDDVTTDGIENCGQVLQSSLTRALDDLTVRYGDEMLSWNWGDAHFAHSDHTPFTQVKALAWLFDVKEPSMGDTYTVNVGRNRLKDEKQPFANTHAASLRAIYDFSDLNNSLFIHSTGQSGNILSPFYDDMAADWANMQYRPMTTDHETYAVNAIGTLILKPASLQ